VYLTEEHDKWLHEDYFPVVAAMKRFPRYKNARDMDPQLKCFVDEKKITIPSEWGLPIPNQEAAYKGLAKYAKDLLPLSTEEVDDMNKAWGFTRAQFGLYMAESKVLPLDEAISHLDMSTSSGAPFNVRYPTKKELFEKFPTFTEWLQEDWERLANDPEYTFIVTNSLKEEMRPDFKIAENSIRVFTAVAVDGTVHGTRLFVDMNEKMYNSHLRSSSAVGMSPLKGNWDRLYRKLKRFEKGYALDESQYDSSLRAFLMWGCARFRWEMLRIEDRTEANLHRVKTYYRNLINSVILTPEGVLVMKKTGNPSGSVNTIADNTLILYTLLAYAWIRLSKNDKEMQGYEAFEAETAKALVGDDNTWTVSDEAHEFYNATTVIVVWKTLGITTTTDSMKPRPAEELDFLSAKTVFLDGVAIPVYERAKLMASLLYAPQKHITPATTLERTAGMLTIGWSDLPFRKFCRGVIAWLIEKYDEVLAEDEKWKLAKCQIQSDAIYYKLYTGNTILLKPQSLSENARKIIKSDKKTIMSSRGKRIRPRAKNAKKAPRRRNRNATKNGPMYGPVRPAMVKYLTPLAGKQQMPRRKRANLAGVGNTKTFQRGDRSCTIVEDEYIAEVIGPATGANFNVTSYPINPGQSGTFPWLSKQAVQWEKYRFNYLEFYYQREVSEFATAGTTGKVILGVDYDASDAPPSTKQQMEDTDPRVDGMPSDNIRLMLGARKMHALYPTLFVRPGGLPGSTDIKTYDAGNFNIATQGLAANTATVGELRVRYSVTLSVPVLESTSQAPANNQVAMFTNTGANGETAHGNSVATGTILPFATTNFNGIGAVNTAGKIVLPAGNYTITVNESTAGLSDSGDYGVDVFTVTGTSPTYTSITGTVAGNSYGGGLADVSNGVSGSVSMDAFYQSDGKTPICVKAFQGGSDGSTSFNNYGQLLIVAI